MQEPNGTSAVAVGNRTETIEGQSHYGSIRFFTEYIRLMIDGFIYLEGASRALPPSRETRRSLYPKKAVGSCFGIRGPNSKARARAFRCNAHSADGPAIVSGGVDRRRAPSSQDFTNRKRHELRFGGGFTRSAAREQITGQRV